MLLFASGHWRLLGRRRSLLSGQAGQSTRKRGSCLAGAVDELLKLGRRPLVRVFVSVLRTPSPAGARASDRHLVFRSDCTTTARTVDCGGLPCKARKIILGRSTT